jgi:RNA polymerase sigma-70 factor, ECF subfamily
MSPLSDVRAAALSDGELVARILAGECELFEIVMRRHNQQLYRAARAITGSETEVEDVLQQAYLNAFAHLRQFEARAQLSTWLTRIVINEASARRRRLGQATRTDETDSHAADAVASPVPGPEQQAYAGELHRVLEAAVDSLPEPYRVVFMLRDVEGMSTTEAGAALALGDEAVKTRLHRARAMLRRAVSARVGDAVAGTFRFYAPRCDRVVAAVLRRVTSPA